MPMTPITKKKVNALMEKVGAMLCHLHIRWQDEKEYEDFRDYVTEMITKFDEVVKEVPMTNAVFIKGMKRPFGFIFDFEGWRVKMGSTTTCVKWSAKKLR